MRSENAVPDEHTETQRRSKGIQIFIVGQAASLVGSEITTVALPIVAVVLLGMGPAELGLLMAASSLPALAAPFYAGVIADRYDRRTVLIVCDVLRAVTLATMVVAYVAGVLTFPALMVLMLLRGVLATVFDSAYFAYIPDIVDRDRLAAVNGRLASIQHGSSIVGRVAGGMLAALLGWLVLLIDAVSYLVSAGTLLLLRSEGPNQLQPTTQTERYLESIRLGFSAMWTNAPVRLLGFTSAAVNFFAAAEGALLVLFALRTLDMSPALVGTVMASSAVGGLVAGLVVERAIARVGNRVVLIGGLAAAALSSVAISVTTHDVAVVVLPIALFVQMAGAVSYMVVNASVRQVLVPPELRGRVFATLRMIGKGVIPLGAALAGGIAAATSIRTAIALAALGVCAVVVWLVLSRRSIPSTLDRP